MSSTPSRRVLCIGDMTVDVVASPVPRLPGPGEVVLAETIASYPGGNALNTAVGLQRLGEAVSFAGTVGDDAFGDLLMRQLERTGLDLRGVRREPGSATPTTLIYRNESEDRRYLHALGVAAEFTGEHVPRESIPAGGVVFVGGYLKLEAWDDEALEKILRRAREFESKAVLNVCIPRGTDVDVGRCLRLLPFVSVFVLNEDEARMLAGEGEPAVQTRLLREAGADWVIVTRGEHGLYSDDGEHAVRMGVYSVPVRDPSGCGDCFNAGLIAALRRNESTLRTLELASAVAAFGAMELGCTAGVPRWSDVEAFVEQNTLNASVDSSAGP